MLLFTNFPNYCDYPCSNFFVFNERSQCYSQNNSKGIKAYVSAKKKFIAISNTNQENFIQAFKVHTNSAKPDVLFLSARQYGHSSIKGDLDECSHAVDDIGAFIND